MSDDQRPQREYSADELAALRLAGLRPQEGGPAHYATGDWWPSELERRADDAERLIPHLRLAAAAMRREIARTSEKPKEKANG